LSGTEYFQRLKSTSEVAMDHSKQVAILQELMSHIEAGTTARTAEVRWNRSEVYASRERLKLEKERLFDTYPLVAGLSGDVPKPGSFIAQDAAGTPFILTRGHDGKVRAFLHRNTLAAIYHSNVTSYETFARNHRMVFAARSINELQNAPEREWQLRPHSTIAYYIFPNTQLLVSRQNISMYRMFPDPDRPDWSLVYQSVYLDAEPATESEKAIGEAALKRLKAVIIEEDFVVAEKSQAALSSGLITEVAYGRNEPALHHYHRTFDEALAQH
jgi:hypothetical protein